MFTAQNYVRVQSLEEAWSLNQKKSNRILGGGCWLRLGRQRIGTLIDLSDLGLGTIRREGDTLLLGAMVTLRQLETSALLQECYGSFFPRMVESIVGVQFRNCATLGGSVAGRFGFSDLLTGLLAVDSQVCLVKGGVMPLARYLSLPPSRDVVAEIRLPASGWKASYQSFRNTHTDLPVLTCAVARRDGEAAFQVSVGARPARPALLTDVTRETLAGRLDQLSYGSNMRAGEAYRRHLAPVLAARAIEELEVKQG